MVKQKAALLFRQQKREDDIKEANKRLESRINQLENKKFRNDVKLDDFKAETDRQVKRLNKLIDLERDYVNSLAEQEKEIETLKKCGDTDHFYGLLQDKRKENKILMKAIEQANQDKISFAVEQFQELKKSLRDKVCLMENDEHCYPQNVIHWQDVVAIIGNQIEELKRETK